MTETPALNEQRTNFRSYYKDGFCISTDKSRLDLRAIHYFLSTQAYWSLNVPLSRIEKANACSLTFGLYNKEKQIGFARVISDYSTIAYLGDVYVLPEFRGLGLSKWLMQTIMDYPDLQGLRRWILSTADAHGLYSQFGWKPVAYPERWMEVHDRNVYAGNRDTAV
jgi:GNAT superfamily N-acetyltransferase